MLKLLRSTAFRLSLIYLAVFALFAGSLIAYISWNTRVIFTNQLADTIEAEVQGLAEQYRLGGVGRLAQIVQLRTRSPTNTLYLVTDFAGRQLVGNVASVPEGTLDQSGLLRITYTPHEGARSGPHEALVRVFSLTGGYRLMVGRDVEDRGRLIDIVRRASILSIGLMIVLGVGGGYYVSRKILARIDAVSETSRTIMTGDLSQRVPLAGSGDEFDRLAASLNAMLDRIEQLMHGLKEVSDNIAHDLKTPLTRLRGRTEAALRQKDPAAYRDALETTLEESEQLIATFNALLMIARTEAGATGGDFREVDLVSAVGDVAELYEPVAEEAGLALELDLPDAASVTGNRELIGQAVANLVDNAVKYGTPADGRPGSITVAVRPSDRATEIVVTDRGPGVPEQERERVVERFARLEASRSRPGAGLGLSLVVAVARLHGGELRLEDNGPGLKAVLALPRHSGEMGG